MTMAADVNRLSVLSYANGFTLWHYKAGASPIAQVREPGFFGSVSSMLSSGDMVLVSAADGGGLAMVKSSAPEGVELASMMD